MNDREYTPASEAAGHASRQPDADPARGHDDDAPPAVRRNDAPQIEIKVIDQQETVLHFKIRTNTLLSKVMTAWANNANADKKGVRFLYLGRRINADDGDTPESLHMEDGDTIEVFREQLGGGLAAII